MAVTRRERLRAGWLAVVGTVVVLGYALLALVQIFRLNPQAAVPGATLDQIRADMAAAGESVNTGVALVIMGIGPLVAVLLLVISLTRTDVSPLAIAVGYLTLIAFGPVAYFAASFGPGMSLADTYGIGGADHSPWAVPLYATSVAAFLALAAIGVMAMARDRRHART